MLEVKNLEVSYGEIQALWGVNFEAKQGDIIGILGPNGAGKTTTFSAIAGLLASKSGNISFNGKDITSSKANERVNIGIAYVPEGRRLFPFMSVLDNLLMGNYSPRARAKREELLQWVFELFPRLKERERQFANTLSGGEAQMLAIGRALMSDPSLLILDEPSMGLAPIIVDGIFKVFNVVNKRGVTVLISEQHVHMVLKVINYGYVLEEGRIALSGTPTELENNEHVKKAYLGI
jgi:branched-chain amino acid transport system ATP-binding protein